MSVKTLHEIEQNFLEKSKMLHECVSLDVVDLFKLKTFIVSLKHLELTKNEKSLQLILKIIFYQAIASRKKRSQT